MEDGTPDCPPFDYQNWSKPDLVAHIHKLESSLSRYKTLGLTPPPHKLKPLRRAPIIKHSTRLIALKFAYLGGAYNGYEYHGNDTPLPTVEEKLFAALLKARLVPANADIKDPESPEAWPGDEYVEYSKCGRTDCGVSAFGQVVAVRVKSNKPAPRKIEEPVEKVQDEYSDDGFPEPEEEEWDDSKELPYAQILNRLLPKDIVILSYDLNPPDGFSARFDCARRHYKYFFTNPSLPPTASPASARFGPLDIDAMNDGASRFLGDHDFRNLCRLDPAKQITNFDRRIYASSIQAVEGYDNVYCFDLQGSAFLWHQVRCMIAILFMVGQGLEKPEIISDLLDLEKYPSRPVYEMANDRPLVLWDCVFPEDKLHWTPTEKHVLESGGRDTSFDAIWGMWHKAQIEGVLATGLMGIIKQSTSGVKPSPEALEREQQRGRKKGIKPRSVHWLVHGGELVHPKGEYVPLAKRDRLRPVEEINKAFLEKNGDWKERRERKRRAQEAEAEKNSS